MVDVLNAEAGKVSNAQYELMVQGLGKEKAEDIMALFENENADELAGKMDEKELAWFKENAPELLGKDEAADVKNDAQAKNKEAGKAENAGNDELKTLQAKGDELKQSIEEAKAKYEAINAKYKTEKAKLDAEKAQLEKLKKQQEELQKENEQLEEDIERTQNELKESLESRQKKATKKAEAEYDKEKDGDWDAFLQKYLDDCTDTALTSRLKGYQAKYESNMKALDTVNKNVESLTNSVNSLENSVNTLGNEAKTLEGTIKNNEAALAGVNKEIDAKTNAAKDAAAGENGAKPAVNAEGKSQAVANAIAKNPKYASDPKYTDPEYLASCCGDIQNDLRLTEFEDPGPNLSKDEIMNLITDDEKALIEEMNVDLYEKLPNGEPRYIFAQGDCDGCYHVYDMGQWNSSGDNSLARIKYGYSCESFNIVPGGNGGIMKGTYNKAGECSSDSSCPQSSCPTKRVYYLDDCETPKSEMATYQTWSPLSFDINGDGVKTSDEIIEYDIDGDGIIDKINDSADAVLVFDKDGDGISGSDGSECFGNSTDLDGDGIADGYKDGFEALKALAKKEGLVGENDTKLDSDDLKTLEDKYGLKIKLNGYNSEATSLLDVMSEINLAETDETTLEDNFDGKGNQLMRQEGATFTLLNGEEREYADEWHRKYEE